jgi:hypothetical protein
MSRGPGRVERAIEAVFKKHPQQSFTTDELCVRVYRLRQVREIRKTHRVAVLRAARKVCPRLWWEGYPIVAAGSSMLFVNRLDLDAYLDGRTRAAWAFLSEPERGWERDASQERGAEVYEWTREHEIAVLQAAGDPRAGEAQTAWEEELQRKYGTDRFANIRRVPER